MAAGSTTAATAEVRKILHEMDQPQRRTIRAAEHLSVKDALPKTFISHTIIHENPSQGRLLSLELDRINHRKSNYLSTHEISRRTFLERQTRSERKWKSQDELRISQMNFPTLRASALTRQPSVEVIYRSPRYNDGEAKSADALLPYMHLRRERTEFIRHGGVISSTRLPTVIEIDSYKLQRYNTFCGQDFKRIKTRKVQRDKKFVNLMSSLCPLKHELDDEAERDAQARQSRQSVDNERPWYMSDSGSESDNDDDMQRASTSRDDAKFRKSVVVFPSVTPRSNVVQDKYAAPIAGKDLTTGKRPSVDLRAQTQYNAKKPATNNSVSIVMPDAAAAAAANKENRTVRKSQEPPKTAPNFTMPPVDNDRLTSPTKVVDLANAIITELGDESPVPKPKKGILKSSRKNKKASQHKDSVVEKREKIKRDLRSKDLRELMEKYGHLRPSMSREATVTSSSRNPREQNEFHSPTLERRFHVKSGAKKY